MTRISFELLDSSFEEVGGHRLLRYQVASICSFTCSNFRREREREIEATTTRLHTLEHKSGCLTLFLIRRPERSVIKKKRLLTGFELCISQSDKKNPLKVTHLFDLHLV